MIVIVILSVFRADYAILSVLYDSITRLYVPGSTPSVSMCTSVESNSSVKVTKGSAELTCYLNLIARGFAIVK